MLLARSLLPLLRSMSRHFYLWALLPLAACADPSSGESAKVSAPAIGESAAEVRAAAHAAPAFDILLAWGEGELEIGRRAPQPEFRGEGPSGIALAPDGRVLLIDRLNHRVLEVDGHGLRSVADVAEDVEHLAIGSDGAMATFSPLRSHAAFFEADGSPAGELSVPRLTGPIARVRLAGSRQLVIESALQERLTAGSPSTPYTEAELLRSKREGAFELEGGRGVVAIVSEGRAAVHVLSPSARGRVRVLSRVEVGEGFASLRLLGLEGDTAVAVAERVEQPGEAIEVGRELVVFDLAKRSVIGRRALPRPGEWVPTEDLAAGGSPLAVALMVPEREGLRVIRIPVSSVVAGGGAK